MSGWVPSLPLRTWVVLGGEVVSAVGSGATVPYLFVYLHVVCGMSVGQTGAMLTVRAAIWVSGIALGGLLADRVGAKTVAVAGLVSTGAGTWGLAAADTPVGGAVALVGYSFAFAVLTPALDALVAAAVPVGPRQVVLGWRYAAFNLGNAAGAGLAAVLLAATSAAEGLPVLYLFDGASFVVFAVLIGVFVRQASPSRPSRPVGQGYRTLMADPALRWICAVVLLVVAAGYAQLHVALPGFATAAGFDTRSLGWVMAANTLAVLLFQVPALRVSAAHRRSRILLAGIVVMVSAWVLIQVAGHSGLTVLVAAAVLFGAGETLFAPVVSALVNDLALEGARGRYNAAQSLAWGIGFLAGAAGVGAVLTAGGEDIVFAVVAGVLGLAAVAVLQLERVLPGAINRIPDQKGMTSADASAAH
ncbi:MFS transporter [Streptomyces sp. NPDC060027]|uniref:MFS transporter n=1 Tax=Streptomyces sp. NPDC060027 TaxID=3347040 RepID=UPI00369D00B4